MKAADLVADHVLLRIEAGADALVIEVEAEGDTDAVTLELDGDNIDKIAREGRIVGIHPFLST